MDMVDMAQVLMRTSVFIPRTDMATDTVTVTLVNTDIRRMLPTLGRTGHPMVTTVAFITAALIIAVEPLLEAQQSTEPSAKAAAARQVRCQRVIQLA